eukprot:m.85157 g.85157  ORF g.85157 m.85157 type:complete len:60 (-) comp21247_c1_seq1:2417-2596(-)
MFYFKDLVPSSPSLRPSFFLSIPLHPHHNTPSSKFSYFLQIGTACLETNKFQKERFGLP